jgi:hypothetical protein
VFTKLRSTKLRLGIALGLAAFGVLALATPAQAAQPASKTVHAAQVDSTLRVVLGKATETPAPHLARSAAEVCTTYGPAVNIVEVATGIVLYTQQLFIQYCYDGQVVTRLTAPSFTDMVIYDSRVNLQRLPIVSNANPPTATLDTLGGVNVFFTPAPGAPLVTAQVVIRAIVTGNGGQSAVAVLR